MSFIPIPEKPGFFWQEFDDRLWKFFPSDEPKIRGSYHTVDEQGNRITTDSLEDDEIIVDEPASPEELAAREERMRKLPGRNYLDYGGLEVDELLSLPDGVDRLKPC